VLKVSLVMKLKEIIVNCLKVEAPMNFMEIVQTISILVGLYLVTNSLWELREGTNKKKYLLSMFFGLFLTILFPNIIY
jgi:hypothetical protein